MEAHHYVTFRGLPKGGGAGMRVYKASTPGAIGLLGFNLQRLFDNLVVCTHHGFKVSYIRDPYFFLVLIRLAFCGKSSAPDVPP